MDPTRRDKIIRWREFVMRRWRYFWYEKVPFCMARKMRELFKLDLELLKLKVLELSKLSEFFKQPKISNQSPCPPNHPSKTKKNSSHIQNTHRNTPTTKMPATFVTYVQRKPYREKLNWNAVFSIKATGKPSQWNCTEVICVTLNEIDISSTRIFPAWTTMLAGFRQTNSYATIVRYSYGG